jgi:uncharacterized Fe-S cluster-containing radical SAM superfamily protein
MGQKRLLMLQLPLLDNDASGRRENFPFAAAYLTHALRGTVVGREWEVVTAPAQWDELGNGALLEQLVEAAPDAVGFTLYLWNIERSLRLAEALREQLPDVRIIVGGPEVAHDHPLLSAAQWVDGVVVGDGEMVLAPLLMACSGGNAPAYKSVGWRRADGELGWGTLPVPVTQIGRAIPPTSQVLACMGGRDVAYMETTRGCPLRCSYCRYHHLHRRVTALSPGEIVARIREFRAQGVKEIRFVDPTFNAHRGFEPVLRELARLNADHELRFFAELKADTITRTQAELLAKANFTEVEVGVQSIDPKVLRCVQRPTNLERLGRGLGELADAGVHTVLDVMYGLPLQELEDVFHSIDWCSQFAGAQVQCMQTLLLPGTDLRRHAERWGMVADALPPYGVQCTSTMSEADIRDIEAYLFDRPDLPADPITETFCSHTLPGLFQEQVSVQIDSDSVVQVAPGRQNRRCLIIQGDDLYGFRERILELIRLCVAQEPDVLWQFVLAMSHEEPIDLLEVIVKQLHALPCGMLDRFASARAFGLLASRRLMVRLHPDRTYAPDWQEATELYLTAHFM